METEDKKIWQMWRQLKDSSTIQEGRFSYLTKKKMDEMLDSINKSSAGAVCWVEELEKKDLSQKINRHRGHIMCDPSCWCWNAESILIERKLGLTSEQAATCVSMKKRGFKIFKINEDYETGEKKVFMRKEKPEEFRIDAKGITTDSQQM